MVDALSDIDILHELNKDYIRSVQTSDVQDEDFINRR